MTAIHYHTHTVTEEGYIRLIQSFLTGGVDSVLYCQWHTPTTTRAHFLRKFYSCLFDGKYAGLAATTLWY